MWYLLISAIGFASGWVSRCAFGPSLESEAAKARKAVGDLESATTAALNDLKK